MARSFQPPPRGPLLASGLLSLVLATMLGATGCERLSQLRQLVRNESCSLRVEVEPKRGITLLIDGAQVASESPFESQSLASGAHVLEVRAPGYHALTLPFTIDASEHLVVPIALRHQEEVTPPSSKHADPPAPPPPPAPPLPAGVAPITLMLTADPPGAVLIDGVAIVGKQARLERVSGSIATAGLFLHYRVGGSDLLELTVPEDGGSFSRDGSPVLPGNASRVYPGATRITRVGPDGSTQSLVLRR